MKNAGTTSIKAFLHPWVLMRENERRFRSLTQSTPDGIMLVDHNSTIIYWNHGARNIFGYSEEEVLGKPSGMLLPEQDRETHRKGFEKLHGTGESRVLGKIFESRGLRKDGSIFPTEISISRWDTADGVCYCAVIRDISEHKRAEQQLRETKGVSRQHRRELSGLYCGDR